MATFMMMTSWEGEFTDDYFAQPDADPAALGMSTEDDGSPQAHSPTRVAVAHVDAHLCRVRSAYRMSRAPLRFPTQEE